MVENKNEDFVEEVEADFVDIKNSFLNKNEKKVRIRKIHNAILNLYSIVVLIIYILLGVFLKIWHPTWIMLVSIPFVASFLYSLRNGKNIIRNIIFPLLVIVYIIVGFTTKLWHPTWVMFLLYPLSEAIFTLIDKIKKN